MVFASLAIFLFSYLVMTLWNWIVPDLFGVGSITWLQALGLLVLSKILFGGVFRGRWGGRRHHYWKARMTDRWKNMTPEQREKFRERFKGRCGWYPSEEDTDESQGEVKGELT